MVDPEQIREEGLTQGEVLEQHTAQPQDSVRWVPEWDESEDARPGENTRIEDDTLLWEMGDFEIALESYETTHWRAVVTIPEHVGELYPREFDLKCHPQPEYGFIRNVEQDGYVTTEAELILQANFQPIHEVKQFVETLAEDAEQSQQFMEDLEAGLDAAAENEEELKEKRIPGAHEDGGLVCPHCKEIIHRVKDTDEGFKCTNCREKIDDYVEDRRETED